MMRRLIAKNALCLAGLLAGCSQEPAVLPPLPPPTKVLARFHFSGADAMAANTNIAKLNRIWALPATVALRGQTLQRLADAVCRLSGVKTNGEDCARLLQPLFDDLLHAESFAAVQGKSNGPAELTFALRLGEGQGRLWWTNLWQFAEACNEHPAAIAPQEGFPSWEVGKSGRLFRLTRAGGWTVISVGRNQLPGLRGTLRQIKRAGLPYGRSNDAWLEFYSDLPHLASWVGLTNAVPDSTLSVSVRAKQDILRTEARLLSRRLKGLSLSTWKIPTNTIRDPLISFTAARGIASGWTRLPWLGRLGVTSFPDQIYLWAQSKIPFLTYAAVPMEDVTNTLDRIAAALPSLIGTNLQARGLGEVRWTSNQHELYWRGLPIIVPFLSPTNEPSGRFLTAGIFPVAGPAEPPPAELLDVVRGTTNLVYYDWEITENRAVQWVQLWQLGWGLAGRRALGTNLLAENWLLTAAPEFGNTITEITFTPPTELRLLRTSHIGLTGFELVSLARWLDDPAFPRFSLDPVPARKAAAPSPPVVR